jgi:hypothetical protein
MTPPRIRNEHAKEVKAVTPGQLYNILHRYMAQAGLLGSKHGRCYKIRPHSIRKFFRTQLSALGLQADYVEYVMGHTISTYNDIKMKGIEYLRNLYASSGLSIRPKTRISKIDQLKIFAESLGLNPDEVLSKDAVAMPHRIVVDSEHRKIEVLNQALKTAIITELKQSSIL